MITTRDYISWSQFNLFHTSKAQFHKRYVLNKRGPESAYLRLGKRLHTALETREIPSWNEDPFLPFLVEQLPRYDFMEDRIEIPFYNTNILSILDSVKHDYSMFIDYKTSKNEWNQIMVDEADQLLFYATVIHLKTNKIPVAKLVWVETTEKINEYHPDEKDLIFTGRWEEFSREFTLDEIEYMVKRIEDTINEIEEYDFIEIDIDEMLVNEYKDLLLDKTNIDKRLNDIKDIVKDLLEAEQAIKGGSDNGTFTLIEKKEWIYSLETRQSEAKFKKALNKIKAQERKEKIAKQKVKTKYIKFS